MPGERAGPVQLIDEAGRRVHDTRYPLPTVERLAETYRWMVLGRAFDVAAEDLARAGGLAVYAPSRGQEACQVGGVLSIGADDWFFPTYRDSMALVARGIDETEVLGMLSGRVHCGYDCRAERTAPQCTPIATHLLHAVGVAHAERREGNDSVALAYLGDGATSEGDFHEALNFAAVFAAPVVFLVQNNGYAISVPLERQSAAPSLAAKGPGYGVPAEQVDGNDAAAVLAVVGEAVGRARAGGGPFLVEALTYRLAGHTNLDDPGRYRDRAEEDAWADRDPIARLGAHLRATGALSEREDRDLHAAAAERAAALPARIGATPVPAPESVVASVYAEPPAHLLERITGHGEG